VRAREQLLTPTKPIRTTHMCAEAHLMSFTDADIESVFRQPKAEHTKELCYFARGQEARLICSETHRERIVIGILIRCLEIWMGLR
jgi:hypothetical protein